MSRYRLKFTLCRLTGGLLSNLGTHKLRNIYKIACLQASDLLNTGLQNSWFA